MLVAFFSFASFFASLAGALHPHTDVTIPIYPMAVKHVVRPDVTIPIYPMAVVAPKHVMKPAVTIPIYPM
jgi:hypothetical protein